MIYCFKVCLVQNARVLFCIQQKCVKSGIKIVFHHCSQIETQFDTYLAYSSNSVHYMIQIDNTVWNIQDIYATPNIAIFLSI